MTASAAAQRALAGVADSPARNGAARATGASSAKSSASSGPKTKNGWLFTHRTCNAGSAQSSRGRCPACTRTARNAATITSETISGRS